MRTTNLPPATTLTVLGWIYLAVDMNAYTTFFYYGGNASSGYAIVGTSGDGVTLYHSNPALETAGSVLSLSTWYHVGLVVSGSGAGQLAVYLNGTLNITADPGTLIMSRIMLGTDTFPDPFNGRMANVLIYDVALTQAEVQQQMRQYVPFRWANLNAWYPLLHANNIADHSPQARAWTVGGTLTTEDGPPIPWVVMPPVWRRKSAAVVPRKAPPPVHRPWRVWRRAA